MDCKDPRLRSQDCYCCVFTRHSMQGSTWQRWLRFLCWCYLSRRSGFSQACLETPCSLSSAWQSNTEMLWRSGRTCFTWTVTDMHRLSPRVLRPLPDSFSSMPIIPPWQKEEIALPMSSPTHRWGFSKQWHARHDWKQTTWRIKGQHAHIHTLQKCLKGMPSIVRCPVLWIKEEERRQKTEHSITRRQQGIAWSLILQIALSRSSPCTDLLSLV